MAGRPRRTRWATPRTPSPVQRCIHPLADAIDRALLCTWLLAMLAGARRRVLPRQAQAESRFFRGDYLKYSSLSGGLSRNSDSRRRLELLGRHVAITNFEVQERWEEGLTAVQEARIKCRVQ